MGSQESKRQSRRKRRKAPSPANKKPSQPAPVAEPPPAEQASSFPLVGIGASAGGLEAIEQFLRHVPEKSGMAFVIVQHLDPTHKGMLVELLQRGTAMPVVQAKDRLKVEPDHVYVIPPNKDMSLLHGQLHLLPPASPRGLNLPIDFFFRSLAEDKQERSIGVILSGMGSDGTLGIRAIKEKGGAAFVQSLSSAKFDGMPRSVADAGLADVIAPVEELPGKITAYLQHLPFISRPDLVIEDKALSALEKIFILLRSQTGNDFSLYKKSTIYRRIERRMGLHQIDTIGHYVRFLRENPKEIELLFKELLIGVTSFFRDPAAWEYLAKEVMPALLALRSAGGVLRAWVPACSTGEEAYSLAMVFSEAMEPFKPVRNISLQIFATDLDREAIEKARLGAYPDNIAADVSPERLRRFFIKEDTGYRVSKEIREMVVFAPQNIISDPPFTKLDVLSCRNLLIYLSPDLQKQLIPLFHYILNPGGVLFLGSAETIGSFSNDMKNLLNSTAIATLFLDGDLHVRRFTTPTTRIIKLISSDTGRPITDIASDLDYPALADDAREVLRTLVFQAKRVATRDGRWFTVRIMPYRTLQNVIDGVVITFTDANDSRALEVALQEQASEMRQVAESLPSLVWGGRPDGGCDYLSRQWIEYTGIPDSRQLQYGWLEQLHPEDQERVRKEWVAAVKAGHPLESEFRIRSKAGQYRWFKSRAVPIRDSHGGILKWYGTSTDIDDVKRALETREQGLEQLAAILEHSREGFFSLDVDLRVTFFNGAAEHVLGRDRRDVVGKNLFDVFLELRATALDRKLGQAVREKAPLTAEARLDGAPRDGWYRVRAYPQSVPEGLSVFVERNAEGPEP